MKSWNLRVIKYRKVGNKYCIDVIAPKGFIKKLQAQHGEMQVEKLFYSITGKKYIEL